MVVEEVDNLVVLAELGLYSIQQPSSCSEPKNWSNSSYLPHYFTPVTHASCSIKTEPQQLTQFPAVVLGGTLGSRMSMRGITP